MINLITSFFCLNQVMRFVYADVHIRATEVVLFVKLGINEVFHLLSLTVMGVSLLLPEGPPSSYRRSLSPPTGGASLLLSEEPPSSYRRMHPLQIILLKPLFSRSALSSKSLPQFIPPLFPYFGLNKGIRERERYISGFY